MFKVLKNFCVICLMGFGLSALAQAASPAPARGKQGLVASAHPLASAAGRDILKQGGNAVDAAVATLLAISVVEPFSAGLGGGGFALLYAPGEKLPRALDFRERAPLAAHRDLYLDSKGQVIPEASTTGHRAVGVPGTIAGAAAMLKQGGTMTFAQVSAAAIRLADDGFVVSPALHQAILGRRKDLAKDPGSRDVFLVEGKAPIVGSLLVQKDLAATLRSIASDGAKAFYQGEIAQAIVGDMAENGGLITAKDLATYAVTWRQPEQWRYRGLKFYSMPLPSSGGLVLREIFSILEQDRSATRPYHDPRSLHVYIEACRRAYADRAEYLGDPAFLRKKPDFLVSVQRLQRQHRSINLQKATPSSELGDSRLLPGVEPQHTSQLIAVDAKGAVVSLTFTVNTQFGAAVLVPGTGVLLNNEMDDFSLKPGQANSFGLVGNAANSVGPAKIPLSSMSPTLVFDDQGLRLAVGSPGGSTIITTVVQIALNVLDYDMNVAEALAAPRLHHQWLPDQVDVEPRALDPATQALLRKQGHNLHLRQPWGNAMAVERKHDGSLFGAADPRGEGVALGL